MQTLDLDCPSCGENLELDAGFAGGVCRCSNCGTLMTVPRDAGRAEQLTAPEPDFDSAAASADLPPSQSATRSRSARPAGRDKKRGKKGKGKKGGAKRGSATIQAGEYRTTSGKVVRVDTPTRVPMAQSKRKQIRIATTVIFLSVVIGIAVVTSIALWAMLTGGKGPGGTNTPQGGGTQPGVVEVPPPTFDPAANPYQLDFANVAGMPIQGDVAIVTEATKGDSAFWMNSFADLLRSGLRKAGESQEPATASVFVATAGAPAVFGDGAQTPLSQIDSEALGKFLRELSFDNNADRTAAVRRALGNDPDVLILIFSGATSDQLEAWDKLLEGKDGVVVHSILIDSSSPRTMQQWLGKRAKGEAISLSSSELNQWKQESE